MFCGFHGSLEVLLDGLALDFDTSCRGAPSAIAGPGGSGEMRRYEEFFFFFLDGAFIIFHPLLGKTTPV